MQGLYVKIQVINLTFSHLAEFIKELRKSPKLFLNYFLAMVISSSTAPITTVSPALNLSSR